MVWDIVILFVTFFGFMLIGLPIAYAIGLSALSTVLLHFPFDMGIIILAQRFIGGLDSFTLLAIPFFILAGSLMNHGGIAAKLIDFAKVIVGRLPGALAHCNVVANMLFGSISGSAVAACAAVGGTMSPLQKKEGYEPGYSAAVNIASCPTGLLIPPSNTFIVYSLISGGTSVAALFVAGYIPGILMGLGIMVVAGIIAKRRGYPVAPRVPMDEAIRTTLRAIPPLFLIVIVMGGIIGGIFTATEASAIAVIYTLFLSMVVYRTVTFRTLPRIILDAAVTTCIVLLLIGASGAMSWAMAYNNIPRHVSDALLALSDNPIVVLLVINAILLVIGMFMDMTPALLIFTPIFLPVVTQFGMDPVHFGVLMAFNLSIGICTPPVGSALFVGCSVAGVPIGQAVKPLLPMFVVLLVLLLAVTYIPDLSLLLPRLLLGYGG